MRQFFQLARKTRHNPMLGNAAPSSCELRGHPQWRPAGRQPRAQKVRRELEPLREGLRAQAVIAARSPLCKSDLHARRRQGYERITAPSVAFTTAILGNRANLLLTDSDR